MRRALFLERRRPGRAWRELSVRQAALLERLRVREVRIEARRRPICACASTAERGSTPTGAATCPAARSSPGRASIRRPARSVSTCRRASVAPRLPGSGSTFDRRPGRLRDRRARRRRPAAALATDAGARFLGELGIGTNTGIDRATGSTLLDEKIAGTIHLALGRSYPETGGTNSSALHWDLICDLRRGGPVGRRRTVHRGRSARRVSLGA